MVFLYVGGKKFPESEKYLSKHVEVLTNVAMQGGTIKARIIIKVIGPTKTNVNISFW